MRRGPRSLQGVLVYIYKDYKFQRIQIRSVSPLRLLTLKIFDSLLHGGSPGFSTKNSNNIIIWHAVDNGKRETLWFSPLSSLPKTQRSSLEERRILIFTKKSTLSNPLTQTYFQSTLLSTCYFKWQTEIRLCLQTTPLVAGCSCYK